MIRKKTIPLTTSFHFVFTKVSPSEFKVSRAVQYQSVYAVQKQLPACHNRSWTDYERAENTESAQGTLKE
jgi:hypothetical protein